MKQEIRSVGKLIFLHLFPGILLTLLYLLFLRIEVLPGYPRLVILGLAAMLSIVPFELGYLFYLTKRETNTYNIISILGLKSSLTLLRYVLYTLGLFLLTGLLITVLIPVTEMLSETVFSWIPRWYDYNEDFSLFNNYHILVLTAVSFVVFTLIAPIVEELYFRGFLLARMKWMGVYGVLVNLVLFSIYHFWSPWLIAARIIAFFPLFYVVYKKDSLKLAIFVHCLANFTDVIAFLTFLD